MTILSATSCLSRRQWCAGLVTLLGGLAAGACATVSPQAERSIGRKEEVLERETARSALLLRRILGPIRLTPVTPQVGRPYYQAETALQVLELIQDPEGGSTSLKWWRRWASNPRPETLGNRHLHH